MIYLKNKYINNISKIFNYKYNKDGIIIKININIYYIYIN